MSEEKNVSAMFENVMGERDARRAVYKDIERIDLSFRAYMVLRQAHEEWRLQRDIGGDIEKCLGVPVMIVSDLAKDRFEYRIV